MVSRETWVQGMVALGAVLSLVVLSGTDVVAGTTEQVLAFVLWNGLIFGGAHLYFVLRGEDGSIPTTARWRFLFALAIWVSLGAFVMVVRDTVVWGIPLWSVAAAIFLGTAVTYLVVEGRAGYRQSIREL